MTADDMRAGMLDDTRLPKHFEAEVRLLVETDGREHTITRHQGIVACTWSAAHDLLEARPWEDLVGDDELIEVSEVRMLGWTLKDD